MADQEETSTAQTVASDLDGRAAAAVLMMLLAEDEAASIVSHLDAQDVRSLGTAMLGIAAVNDRQIAAAIDLFTKRYQNAGPFSGDLAPRVRSVIEQALGPARAGSLLADIAPSASPQLADMLDWLDAEALASILKTEHPQVGALLLSSLGPEEAAAALAMFDEGKQADLLLRAARLGKVSMDAMLALEDIVSRYSLGDAKPPAKMEIGGSMGVAKIMNNLGRPIGNGSFALSEKPTNLSQMQLKRACSSLKICWRWTPRRSAQ